MERFKNAKPQLDIGTNLDSSIDKFNSVSIPFLVDKSKQIILFLND